MVNINVADLIIDWVKANYPSLFTDTDDFHEWLVISLTPMSIKDRSSNSSYIEIDSCPYGQQEYYIFMHLEESFSSRNKDGFVKAINNRRILPQCPLFLRDSIYTSINLNEPGFFDELKQHIEYFLDKTSKLSPPPTST